jgi:hypothetical protein
MKLEEPACSIVHKDGQSFLVDPEGKILPRQIWTRVTQVLNEPAYAIVKVLVNLKDTKDEGTHH